MIVFPMDKPVIRGIHASYVDLAKLVQYYQNKIGAGCLYCRSSHQTGVLFFASKKITSGFFDGAQGHLEGATATDYLISVIASNSDLFLDIYEIDENRQSFWARLPFANPIHTNLSTAFTDLLKLLKKMTSEKLTGYIDIAMESPNADGRIFLIDGMYIGCTMAENENNLQSSKTQLSELIKKAGKYQGIFNVYQVVESKATVFPEARVDRGNPPQQQTLVIMAGLLQAAEKLITRSKQQLPDFQTLLKKQFVKNAEVYPFLDPFTGEFEYVDGAIVFSGQALEQVFVKGIFVSVQALFSALAMDSEFEEELSLWREQYAVQLDAWGVVEYAN